MTQPDRAEHRMMAGIMPGSAADHGALQAALGQRGRRQRRERRDQNRGCGRQ